MQLVEGGQPIAVGRAEILQVMSGQHRQILVLRVPDRRGRDELDAHQPSAAPSKTDGHPAGDVATPFAVVTKMARDHFTGTRMGAPLAFTRMTTNLAGAVLLALRPTTWTSSGPS
jgi:hypothetical protein